MKVILAGYNVDTDVISELQKASPNRQDVTPETLSASYARISRDPRGICELRKQARDEVQKARKSNKAIIFKMGHHSVAEHAVFNFDIVGVSRLAIEELEHFRLCSFTEKSQRYITLKDDFVVPDEIKNTPLTKLFTDTISKQNELYHKLNKNIFQLILKKYPDLANDPKNQSLLEGWAKEDARYITSMATEGQLGQTINARNLELLLRRFAGNPLSEVREIGKRLWESVEKVAPSIILFYKENNYDKNTYPEIRDAISKIKGSGSGNDKEIVRLVNFTRDADDTVLASIVHTSSELSFKECMDMVKTFSDEKKKEIFKAAFKNMEFYDSTLREFENNSLTYEMIVSSSCFAQLKRHRMATLTSQAYNPNLGVTIPDSVIETGMKKEFLEVINITEDCYEKIHKINPFAATYILTNAHRRRVLFTCNARELYHVSRLREDKHAQWDIQNISKMMSDLAKGIMPLTMLLIGGKDRYPAIYNELFGKFPKIVEMGG